MIQISENAGEVWGNVIGCAKRIRGRATEGLSDRQLASFFKAAQTILKNLEAGQAGSRSK